MLGSPFASPPRGSDIGGKLSQPLTSGRIDHSRRTDAHVNYSKNTKQHELLNIPSSPCETLGRVKCAEIVDSRGACLATTHLAARVTGPSSALSGKGGLDATRVRRGDLSELLPQHLPAQCPS